jgi:hypothetical protein
MVALLLAAAGLLLLGTGSAVALAPPEDEKAEIVLTSGGRVVSIAADGSDRKILSRPGPLGNGYLEVEDYSPSISPDGSSLLFTRDDQEESATKIIVANRDGSLPHTVLAESENGESFWGAVWSSDGSRIFVPRFLERRNRLDFGISSIGRNGDGYRVITRQTAKFVNGQIEGNRDVPIEIEPAPDGQSLLVTYSDVIAETRSKLMLVDVQSGSRRLLKRDAFGGQFSPDGDQIVFASERERRERSCYEGRCSYDSQIFVMDSDGSGLRRLMPSRFVKSSSSPSWAPDGSRIAFTAYSRFAGGAGSSEVYSVNPDGTCLTRLTNGSPDSEAASWGPEPGRSASPGSCGDLAPLPLVEVTPGAGMLNLRPRPLWLGLNFSNLLLSDLFRDGRGLSQDYSDCAALKATDCPMRVNIDSAPVCEAAPFPLAYSGKFLGLRKAHGGLVMRSRPSHGRGCETTFFSGGTATELYTFRKVGGRPVGFVSHLAMIRKLRPVDTVDLSGGALAPAVFRRVDVRKARRIAGRVERGVAGKLSRTDRGYLRFARHIERLGPVRTVNCPTRRRRGGVLPGPATTPAAAAALPDQMTKSILP